MDEAATPSLGGANGRAPTGLDEAFLVVLVTAMAGAGFAVLRLRLRSVAAPALAHAALNSMAYLVARRAGQRESGVDLRRDVGLYCRAVTSRTIALKNLQTAL